MRLPKAKQAIVPQRKVTRYLLASTHETGRHKASWLRGYGFRLDDWEALAGALKAHATAHHVTRTEDSRFGTRYVVDGVLGTPDRRGVPARAIWFVETDESVPRFVTVYPLRVLR